MSYTDQPVAEDELVVKVYLAMPAAVLDRLLKCGVLSACEFQSLDGQSHRTTRCLLKGACCRARAKHILQE